MIDTHTVPLGHGTPGVRHLADPVPADVADYRGPGASAVHALARYMRALPQGADLAEATDAVRAETGLSGTTVWKAWLVLLDLDRLAPVGSGAPRPGRHRERHVWRDGAA